MLLLLLMVVVVKTQAAALSRANKQNKPGNKMTCHMLVKENISTLCDRENVSKTQTIRRKNKKDAGEHSMQTHAWTGDGHAVSQEEKREGEPCRACCRCVCTCEEPDLRTRTLRIIT